MHMWFSLSSGIIGWDKYLYLEGESGLKGDLSKLFMKLGVGCPPLVQEANQNVLKLETKE